MRPGLYEQIINKQMNEELASVPEECRYQEKVDSAEASRVLATYAAELMKRKMDAMYEASGDQALSDQIAYINKVIGVNIGHTSTGNAFFIFSQQILKFLGMYVFLKLSL